MADNTEQLDPQVVALAKAIRWRETEKLGKKIDPWTAVSKDGGQGAYQFTSGTFQEWGKRYLKSDSLEMTKENQNKVAYYRIKHLKEQGYSPAEIAAAWNGGIGVLKDDKWKTHKGVNKYGVKYDVPAYVEEVYQKYQEFKPKADLPPKDEEV